MELYQKASDWKDKTNLFYCHLSLAIIAYISFPVHGAGASDADRRSFGYFSCGKFDDFSETDQNPTPASSPFRVVEDSWVYFDPRILS